MMAELVAPSPAFVKCLKWQHLLSKVISLLCEMGIRISGIGDLFLYRIPKRDL